jgi:hypothetical protein
MVNANLEVGLSAGLLESENLCYEIQDGRIVMFDLADYQRDHWMAVTVSAREHLVAHLATRAGSDS